MFLRKPVQLKQLGREHRCDCAGHRSGYHATPWSHCLMAHSPTPTAGERDAQFVAVLSREREFRLMLPGSYRTCSSCSIQNWPEVQWSRGMNCDSLMYKLN